MESRSADQLDELELKLDVGCQKSDVRSRKLEE